MTAPTTVHLLFLGFPSDVELGKRDPRSKRKPNRKIGVSERPYGGVHPDTRDWRPGEPRQLTTQRRANRRTGNIDIIFDAEVFADNALLDFGPGAEGWQHLPASSHSSYGFERIDAAGYKRRRATWDKKIRAELEDEVA